MAKPVILTVDDDPEVLQAIARDLRSQYGSRFRIGRADSGQARSQLLLAQILTPARRQRQGSHFSQHPPPFGNCGVCGGRDFLAGFIKNS
jgi:hypothetical protein